MTPVRAVSSPFGALGSALIGAGLVDLVLGRLIVGIVSSAAARGVGSARLQALADTLEAPSMFAHGMLVVLAAALAVVALVRIVQEPELAAPPRRITILVLTSFALPVVALAIFFPVRPGTVFVALTATAFVGFMAALNTSMFRLRRAVKVWVWLVTLPIVLGYVDTLTRVAPVLGPLAWPAGAEVAQELAAVLSGLLAPAALLPGRVWRAPTTALAVAVAVALVPTIAFGLLAVLTWPVTQGLALRAVGIGLQVPYGQALYLGALFGWVVTAVYHLWPRPHAGGVHEIGISMCALFFGGIGTFTPFRIALLLLGVLGLALGLHRLARLELSAMEATGSASPLPATD